MTDNRKISLNFVIQMIAFIANLSVSLFLTPYLVVKIGKNLYGFAGLANQFTEYISVITIALNSMLSRFLTISFSRNKIQGSSEYISSVYFTNVLISLILLPFLTYLALHINRFINVPFDSIGDIKILFILIFIAFLVNLPGSCYNSSCFVVNRLDLSNLCNLACIFIRIAVILLLLKFFEPKVWYLGLASLIITITGIVVNLIYYKKLLPNVKISFKFYRIGRVIEILKVGIWNTINQLSQILLTGMDLTIANIMVGVYEMNMLSYGKMLPLQLVSLVTMTGGLFGPLLTRIYSLGDMGRFVGKVLETLKITGLICSVPVIGVIVFGKDFYRLWLVSLSAQEIEMVSILSILTLLPLVFSVYIFPLYSVNTITARLKLPVIVLLTIGGLNVIFVLLLTNYTELGVYAVAGVSSILSLGNILIFTPIYVAYTLKTPMLTFYSPIKRGLINDLLLLVVMLTVKYLIPISDWVTFVMAIFVAAIIGYLIGFYIVLSRTERKTVINSVRRRK